MWWWRWWNHRNYFMLWFFCSCAFQNRQGRLSWMWLMCNGGLFLDKGLLLGSRLITLVLRPGTLSPARWQKYNIPSLHMPGLQTFWPLWIELRLNSVLQWLNFEAFASLFLKKKLPSHLIPNSMLSRRDYIGGEGISGGTKRKCTRHSSFLENNILSSPGSYFVQSNHQIALTDHWITSQLQPTVHSRKKETLCLFPPSLFWLDLLVRTK